MARPVQYRRPIWVAFALVTLLVAWVMFLHLDIIRVCKSYYAVNHPTKDASYVLVTGYCNCGKCCGWSPRFLVFGSPVYNYGPLKGQPKEVGVTANGTPTRHGTIAADLSRYPMGTRLRVPGYGEGVVEDVGGAIRGRHIDIWFPTHKEAREWGSKWLKVEELVADE